MIRMAVIQDIPAIAAIYESIIDREERGELTIGWQRGVYPTEKTALAALEAGDLFVLEDGGRVIASARINKSQMPAYAQVNWKYEAPDDHVMVLHTLTVDPAESRKGYAKQFLRFYETFALENGCRVLRIDTNARNTIARCMYAKDGYIESGIIPCVFNGIEGVNLVCLEKLLKD